MGSNPLWDFTPQHDLPYPYHEHATRPEICGHWHKQYGPGGPAEPEEQKLIPVVRAYASNSVSASDTNWLGFLVWYTGSIHDDPIFVAKDETDERNWGINEELFEEAIFNALHPTLTWTTDQTSVTFLDKQHDTFYTDGVEPRMANNIFNCGNVIDANGSDPYGGFNVTEADGIIEWNESLYASSWPGSYNHQFIGYETNLGYPDHPRILTGEFSYDMPNAFSDSYNLQTVAYEWKDASDPVWDLPEPDDYGPTVHNAIDSYITSYGTDGGQLQDTVIDTYSVNYHVTPLGYDNSRLSWYCGRMHQLWGFGHIVVDGEPIDDVWTGGAFDPDTCRMGAGTNDEDKFYQGCDISDWGGNDGTPLPFNGAGSVNGHAWIFLADTWPAGIYPVYYEWYDGGSSPWTREQYHIVGGTLFDKSNGEMGFFDAWEGRSIYQYQEYWSDYEVRNGIYAINVAIDRYDEYTINYAEDIIVYRPYSVFEHSDGSSTTYQVSNYNEIIPDRRASGDSSSASGTVGTINLSGIPSYVDVYQYYTYVSYGDNASAFCAINVGDGDTYVCVANHMSWDHARLTAANDRKCHTWLIWYNGVTRTYEDNARDIDYTYSSARYQTYTAVNDSTTYYHNVWDNDTSSNDGTSSSSYRARKRFALLYADTVLYTGMPGSSSSSAAGHDPRWEFERQNDVGV